ncbi:MAG: radical SAM protein [Magnetospirillum sp.]|nr:radical SAM protein [Magnetospirillum sp.]
MTIAKPVASSNKVNFDVKFRTQMENKIVELLSPKDIDALLAEKCGPRYWDYRANWAKGMKFEGAADFPLSLDVENLNHCNFACHHCMFSSKEAHPDTKNRVGKRMMDLNLYKKAIDEGGERGLAAITHGVQCEPMMHPDIVEMVSYAERRGIMDQRIGTNGSLLTGEMSERLIDAGLARLEVSLDAATAETYKLVRKGKDAIYENIIANIHRFLDIRAKRGTKFPILRVSIVKMNINRHEVDQFVDYWKDYADYFSLQEPINYQMNLPNTAIEWEKEQDKDNFRCDKPFTRVFMRWDGTLHPCFPLNIPGFETFDLGNFKEE